MARSSDPNRRPIIWDIKEANLEYRQILKVFDIHAMKKIPAILSLLCASALINETYGNFEIEGELRKWHRITFTFDGPFTSEQAEVNPFMDYRLRVEFRNGDHTLSFPAITRPMEMREKPERTAGINGESNFHRIRKVNGVFWPPSERERELPFQMRTRRGVPFLLTE